MGAHRSCAAGSSAAVAAAVRWDEPGQLCDAGVDNPAAGVRAPPTLLMRPNWLFDPLAYDRGEATAGMPGCAAGPGSFGTRGNQCGRIRPAIRSLLTMPSPSPPRHGWTQHQERPASPAQSRQWHNRWPLLPPIPTSRRDAPPVSHLARISHRESASGHRISHKSLCRNDFQLIRRGPRCRQSVAEISPDLHPLKDVR